MQIKINETGISILNDFSGISFEAKVQSLFQELKLIKSDKIRLFEEIQGFQRTSTECYHAFFDYQIENKLKQRLVAKAIISGYPAEITAQNMWRREQTLRKKGIKTGEIYGQKKAILYQKYIPFDIAEINFQPDLIEELIEMAARLDQAGFDVLELCNNLRSDSKHLYIIDFGQDLGDLREGHISQRGLKNVLQYNKKRLHLPKERIISEYESKIKQIFDT